MALERTLVQIRERPLLDVLDLALVVVRNRPWSLGLAALVGIAPFATINALAFHKIQDLAPGIPLFLWMLEAPLATAPLTVMLGDLMFGQRPTIARVASRVAQSVIPLIVVHGFLRIVLFFLIPSHLAFSNEIILLEKGPWWSIFRRGSDLCRGRAGPLFFLGILQLVLVYLFATIAFIGTGRLYQAMMVEDLTWDVPGLAYFGGLRFQLPIWLVVGFFAVVRFLIYIDQRIRLEGWEVELRLRSAAQTLEEARRW